MWYITHAAPSPQRVITWNFDLHVITRRAFERTQAHAGSPRPRGAAAPFGDARAAAPRSSSRTRSSCGASCASDHSSAHQPSPPPQPIEFCVSRWLASYCLTAAAFIAAGALLPPRDDRAARTVAALPSQVYAVPAAAFASSAAVSLVGLALQRGGHLGWCAGLNAYVGGITAFSNGLHLLARVRGGAAAGTRLRRLLPPAVTTPWGATLLPLRYAAWSHTTPALIALMASVCAVERVEQYKLALLLDELMFVTGLLGSLCSSPWLSAFWIAASTAAMLLMLHLMWRWFTVAMLAAPRGSRQRGSLRFCRAHTMVLWCSFPTIVALEFFFPRSVLLWEVAYSVADFGAKAVWAAMLVQGNALVAESHRRSSRNFLADVAQAELVDRLRASLTLRDRLRAAASHELRTPLGVIIGLADKVMSTTTSPGPGALPPPSPRISQPGVPHPRMSMCGAAGGVAAAETSRALAAIKAAGVRVLALVDDLADDAQAAAAERFVQLSCEAVQLRALVAEVLRVHEGLQTPGVKLVNAIPAGLPAAHADRVRLAQALHRLLAAAVRDTHAGSITVSAEAVVSLRSSRTSADGCGGEAEMDAGDDADVVRFGSGADSGADDVAAGAECDVDSGQYCVVGRAGAMGGIRENLDNNSRAANMVALHVSDTGSGEGAAAAAAGCASSDGSSGGGAHGDGADDAGLGLGVHGAGDLVQAHGGQMCVIATPGVGTRVTLTLPLARSLGDALSPPGRYSLDGGSGGSRRASSDGGSRRGSLDSNAGGPAPRRSSMDAPRRYDSSPPDLHALHVAMERTVSPTRSGERCSIGSRGSLGGDSSGGCADPFAVAAAAAAATAIAEDAVDAPPPPPLVMCVGGVGAQASLGELLSGAFTVRCVRDVDAAVASLAAPERDALRAQRWPEIILLDAAAAGMPAVHCLQAACPANTPPPPVIVLLPATCAEPEAVAAAAAVAAGAADVIRPPLSREVLHARLGAQLRLRESARDAAASMALLRRMLPDGVISRLKDGQTLIAESMDNVTVLFSDVVSFTSLSSQIPTTDIIMMLNELFSAFDALVDKHKCYKVETIGDAYMVVAGQDDSPDHTVRVMALAQDMLDAAERVRLPRASIRTLTEHTHLALPHETAAASAAAGGHIRIRIGMHSGSCFAGVVGTKMPRFSFFGDSINTASRMESTSFPMAVQLSSAAYEAALEQGARAERFVPFGKRAVRGKGTMQTYLLRVGAWEEALHRQEAAAAESLDSAAVRCASMRRSSSQGMLPRA